MHKNKKNMGKARKCIMLLLFFIFVSMLLLLISRSIGITEAMKQKEELEKQVLAGGIVDFPKLKQINSDIVGWLRIETLGIEEPFVKGKDNTYYGEHSIYKKKQIAGTVFMDYKNQSDFSNTNTILYGKSIAKGLRLANLQSILKEKQSENIEIEVNLESRTLRYKVFASYVTNDIESIRGNRIIDKEVKKEYQEQLQKNSEATYEMPESKTGQILTLISYQSASNKNIVVHAMEIEKE